MQFLGLAESCHVDWISYSHWPITSSNKQNSAAKRNKIERSQKIIQTVEDRGVVQPIRKDDSTHVTRFNQSKNIALM
jgi:hypothetical protein